MRLLMILYSFILHGFLGFIWIFYILKALDLFNSMGKTVWAAIIVGVGTVLFLDLSTRVFESFSKDKKDPVRIAGYISFGLVVLGWLLFFYQK